MRATHAAASDFVAADGIRSAADAACSDLGWQSSTALAVPVNSPSPSMPLDRREQQAARFRERRELHTSMIVRHRPSTPWYGHGFLGLSGSLAVTLAYSKATALAGRAHHNS